MEIATKCAICGEYSNSDVHLPANGLGSRPVTELFSARRLPDRIYYQWVRCKSCDLLRSDPVHEVDLARLYEKSGFDYSSELEGLTKTYMKIVNNLLKVKKSSLSIYEVGGGNGFFLAAAKDSGFKEVCGVEPSAEAIEMARPDIKAKLIKSMMGPGVIPRESFDVGAMFHTLDHLPDPGGVLTACKDALVPGGLFVVAVHNEQSISARLLGGKSPIFDIEHTYLFSQATAKKLFQSAGFVDVESGVYWNTYSLAYLLHLLPLNQDLKTRMLSSALGPILRRIKLTVPLGNIWISGRKPI